MNVTLSIYQSGQQHKLTVVARPHAAAALGEFVLCEGRPLRDLGPNPGPLELLRSSYKVVAELAALLADAGPSTV